MTWRPSESQETLPRYCRWNPVTVLNHYFIRGPGLSSKKRQIGGGRKDHPHTQCLMFGKGFSEQVCHVCEGHSRWHWDICLLLWFRVSRSLSRCPSVPVLSPVGAQSQDQTERVTVGSVRVLLHSGQGREFKRVRTLNPSRHKSSYQTGNQNRFGPQLLLSYRSLESPDTPEGGVVRRVGRQGGCRTSSVI